MNIKGAVLVIGADSNIGQKIYSKLNDLGINVIGTTRRKPNGTKIYLDLSKNIKNFCIPAKIQSAIICSAVSSQKKCEEEPQYSWRINVGGTLLLTEQIINKGIFTVFLSSNLVFDGNTPFSKQDEKLNPKTEYGRQKAEVEKNLLFGGNKISIVRFSKIFYPGMPLIQEWIANLNLGKEINPFYDMVVSPIPISFAVDVLIDIIKNHIPGIIQVSGDKDISYLEVATFIAKKLNFKEELIRPVSFRSAGIEYTPLYTTLDTTRLKKELKMIPPDVYETIITSNKF